MTGGSFYHAMNKTMIESYSSKYLEFISKGKWDMDPLNPNGQHWNQPYNGNEKTGNPWSGEIAYNSELACWYALINPDKAASTFLPYLDPDTANNPSEFGTTPINLFSRTEKGVPETYHFIRFLQDYGTPDPLPVYATNTPYSMTFVKNGVRTYVGYNPTNAPLDIAFSDSRIIKSVQPKQFGIWPSGLPGPVNASFRADPVSGFLPLQVNFTDSSQGQIVAWAWTFGDGGSSTAQNPSHTFTTEGTFNVTLIITDSTQKTSSYSQTITVSLGQASFTASPMGGIAPLLVKFTDTSGGVITSWAWTFGDGGSSTEQNPTHTFTTDGAFNVTLSVTDSTQRTSSCSETIIVKKSGELPGNFSISTLDSGSGTIGLYPSIATNGANQTYIAYFSSSASPPWADGTGGSVGVITLDTGTTPVTIQKEKNVAALTYHVLPPQVIQPEWGRSVITLDAGQKPVVAYINSGDTNPYYPQKLVLAYKSDDGWGQSKVADAFPWYPSVTGQGGEFPTAGFISGTGKNVNYLFNNDKDYKKPWGNVYVTPSGDQRTFFSDLAFLTHLYNGTEKTPSMVYYNQTSQDILDSWLPNKQAVATWNTERIWSGVNAGWLSAASDPGTGILGICWYDLTDKTLKFTQRQSGGSWSTPELVDTSGHDVGSNCSLAYGPASGIVPGPGISYYDATTRSLRFAWKDTSGWHTTEVDTGGAGTSSSLAYSSNGYPRIAYRHEDENALKVAYLKEGTGISADFTSDLRNGPVPLTVRFSDTSLSGVSGMSIAGTGNPDSSYGFHYWWDFDGDGDWEAEDDPNPVYTYAEAGSYSVRMLIHIKIFLLFFDLDVWGIADKGDYINATGPSAANFTASPLSGTPPLTVNFTDTSIGNYSAWNWTFGDGTGSSEQNPVHTYEGIGKYSVTLEVDGKGGSEITRKPGYIDVNSGALSGQAGILKISSDPDGAAIILDGVFQKTTPVDSLIARAGYHRLTLQKQGYQDSNQVISVSAGNLTVIPRVKLREIPA
jgi:PKD repeat protein